MTQAWKTVAIALVSSSLSAFGTNLVTNGTFDTDLTGWTTRPATYSGVAVLPSSSVMTTMTKGSSRR